MAMDMNEKTMVADTLTGINGELVRFAEMIPQTEHKELKTTLKQLRTACEKSQEELYEIARSKSYYVPADAASKEDITHVKSLFTGCK
jgi:spore coat protein CotF